LGINAKEYLRSSDHLVNGIKQAVDRYKPDGIPVTFDLQLEAEALGCTIEWQDDNPPAVVSHPLYENTKLEELEIPKPDQARLPIVMDATKKIRSNHPDIALYGLITGPFTLALHLLGTDIFIKMYEEPDSIFELLEFTKNVACQMAEYYIEAGCDIIAVVDPMTSQIDPVLFEQFVYPSALEIFEHIRNNKALGSFFVCGQAQQNIEIMCKCKPDNISIDENIPLDYVKDVALQNNISFGGNMKLTVVLLMGSQENCQREALDCMDAGGYKGFILAPGCDIPMDTPPQNLEAIGALVNDPYQQNIIRALEIKETAQELLNMNDYGQAGKVVVDIITLDSESCAPCQYMVEAVKKVAPHFEGIVEWREHAIKKLEAVTFMNSLMVKNIPTICIDGKIAFVSQIPPKNELINAIQKRINEKLKLKIKTHKGEIHVLGEDLEACEQFRKNIIQAKQELGTNVQVKINTSQEALQSYGIIKTPAAVLVSYKTKVQGYVPSVDVIKEWLKDI
jgi:uroporphyrinogen decarboxylase